MDRRNFIKLLALTPYFANTLLLGDDTTQMTKQDIVGLQSDDIFLSPQEMNTLTSSLKKLNQVKNVVGYGRFNIISFDEVLKVITKTKQIPYFTKQELSLLEKLFYENPNQYGFYGEKTIREITTKISLNDVVKVPYTGHYLFKGDPLNSYNAIKKDIGKDVILTSGVRGVIKQMSLYIEKINNLNGNISLACKSIAPPAYTHHAVSDFDVGNRFLGAKNFSLDFMNTNEYKNLVALDYVSLRYTQGNGDGVMFEPWHIKVS